MLSERMKKAFEKNGGILSLKEATALQFSKESLRKAYLRGDLKKEDRGIYLLGDEYYDQMLITQKIFRRGIFSNETAVFLYNYSTFIPQSYHMTFPYGYHSNRFAQYMVKPTFATSKFYQLGVSSVENWSGNLVVAYDRERTVIDILRSNVTMAEVKEEVIDNYLYDSERNLAQLVTYARLMKMEKDIEQEVLKHA